MTQRTFSITPTGEGESLSVGARREVKRWVVVDTSYHPLNSMRYVASRLSQEMARSIAGDHNRSYQSCSGRFRAQIDPRS